jgi:hypothetical protein
MYEFAMKPSRPVLQFTSLLDQLRECLRCNYYSLKKEKYYVYWVLFFVHWSGRTVTFAHVELTVAGNDIRAIAMSDEAIFLGRAL